MHLPDHFLDPATAAATAIISGGAVAYAVARVRSETAKRIAPNKSVQAAAVGAAIFAAQMVNFPVAAGTSGHLIGGALAGLLLGPWMGLVTMAAVLTVQAVVFGDGGILALGANILNMGVIGVAIGATTDRLVGAESRMAGANSPFRRAPAVIRSLAIALAGWLSVIAAALACALEMAASGAAVAAEVVPAMLGAHAIIGLGEAAITGLVVALVNFLALRFPLWRAGVGATAGLPSSVAQGVGQTNRGTRFFAHPGRAGLIVGAIIVVALSPLASPLPDGLESAAESLSTLQLRDAIPVIPLPSFFADYTVPGIAWPAASTILAGLLGVAIVYLSLAGAASIPGRRS